jgi:hypothetical protein
MVEGIQPDVVGNLQTVEPGAPRRAQLVLAGVLVVLIVGSWWPFRVELPSVYWRDPVVQDDGSWRFAHGGLAGGEAPPPWLEQVLASGRFELELVIRPAASGQSGPARILSLSADAGSGRDTLEQNLVVGQDGADLVVRFRQPDTDLVGRPPLTVPAAMLEGQRREVTIRADVDELVVSVDGQVEASTALPASWPATWDPDAVLTLGNTPSAVRPWRGEVEAAAMRTSDATHDLLAAGSVTALDRWEIADRRLGALGGRSPARQIPVGLLHVAAGVLLGAALVRVRPQRSVVRTVLLIVLISLVLNAGKLAIDGRHASTATFLLQVAGGGLGMAWAISQPSSRRPSTAPR